MKKISLTLSILLVVALLLSGCKMSASKTSPTTESDMVYTAAALTVQAKMNEGTPQPEIPTLMGPIQAQPTSEPNQQSPQQIFTSAPVSSDAPCDRAIFVDDISIPDNTTMSPGSPFTKTWRIQNDGTCTWTTGYSVVFDSGDEMSAPTAVALNNEVPPGQAIDISVNLRAPSSSDTYRSNFKLKNASGEIFGVGNFDDPFWVIIKVEGPTAVPFAVTNASFEMIPGSYTGGCPFPVTMRGKITTNAPGKVTYYYQREDGFKSPSMEIDFESAGQKNIPDFSMPIGTVAGYSWTGKVSLYIDFPNNQSFNEQSFTVNCTSP
ncbi:MAG TPA: NBR1-Ig-like domain-containing protein [Anaerolineaceae bacterium]|nr:NBR1-Ig-like domain-containing protein [Anaerolineaceae bacterium]